MKKKRLMALALTGLMTVSLFAGCGDSGSDGDTSKSDAKGRLSENLK